MRILTLDDMESRQREFRRWFVGHTHDEAQTAPDAIRLLEYFEYDLVMLDHDLAEEHYLTLSEGLSEDLVGDGPLYSPGTGMDVVDHILQMPRKQRPKKVIVHSWNMVRSVEMYARLQEVGVLVWKIPFNSTMPFTLE
jgi:CheY-like chemotaxis protein